MKSARRVEGDGPIAIENKRLRLCLEDIVMILEKPDLPEALRIAAALDLCDLILSGRAR